jgi:uncharacterized protein YkuJ
MGKETKKSGLAPAAFASDPMAQIDALIKEAKRLKKNQEKINKPRKRFDKGGSNMAKKNFSSKELMMKSQYAQKNTKPKKETSRCFKRRYD